MIYVVNNRLVSTQGVWRPAMATIKFQSTTSSHAPSCHRWGFAIWAHSRTAVPRLLQTIPGDDSTSTHHSLDPTTPGRVGESLVQPPGQSFRSLRLSRPELWVQDWVPAQFPPQVRLLQHGVSPPPSRGHFRVSPEGMHPGQDAGPFPWRRQRNASPPREPVRGHSERPQHWEMEAHHRSLISSRRQCQWRNWPLSMFHGLHYGWWGGGPSVTTRTGGAAGQNRHRVGVPPDSGPPAGSPPPGHEMGRQSLRWPHAAIWAPLGFRNTLMLLRTPCAGTCPSPVSP